MALMLKEKLGLIDGSNTMEDEIEVPNIYAALLNSLLEESHCDEDYCNEEQVNRLTESLEAEIRMRAGKPWFMQ